MKSTYTKGSPYACGITVGRENREGILRLLELSMIDAKNVNFLWKDFVEKSKEYYVNPPESCGMALEFFDGVGEGAEISPHDIRAMLVEELLDGVAEKCTNVVVGNIIGQNNDLSWDYKDLISHTRMDVEGFGRIHLIGPAGFYMSVGLNCHGIVLTGTELSPNDEKIGIPRSVIALSILFTKSMDEAVKMSTIQERASSYNNIIVCGNQVISVEGSATDYEIVKLDRGFLVHSNHYISDKMLKYETPDTSEPANMNSQARYTSAKGQAEHLVNENVGADISDVKKILCSHENGVSNNSVCRHGEHNSTVFSYIYKYGNPYFEVAIGNPCENEYKEIVI